MAGRAEGLFNLNQLRGGGHWIAAARMDAKLNIAGWISEQMGGVRRREAERTGRDIVNQANSAFNYMKLRLQIVYPTTRGCLGVEKQTWLLGFCFAPVTFMIIVFPFHPQFEGLEEFAEVIDALKENGVLVVEASSDDVAKANDERLGNFQVKQAL